MIVRLAKQHPHGTFLMISFFFFSFITVDPGGQPREDPVHVRNEMSIAFIKPRRKKEGETQSMTP